MTRSFFVLPLMAAIGCFTCTLPAMAQHAHSDVEFSYENNKIAIEFGPEGRVFEGEFPVSGTSEQETDDPGFASEASEGLGVNPGDIIDYNILGPLEYHTGVGFAPVPSGASIIIGDNPSGLLTVDAATVGPISGPGAIAQADSGGDVHTHIEFSLDPLSLTVPEYGAYGLRMELTTDALGIASSDPFYIVFNFGLEEDAFEGAVGAFALQAPEPVSATIVGCALAALGLHRRRQLPLLTVA